MVSSSSSSQFIIYTVNAFYSLQADRIFERNCVLPYTLFFI